MLSERERKLLRRLRRRKNREANGRFLAEGIRVLEDLFASPVAVDLVVSASSIEDSERGLLLVQEVGRRGIPHRLVPDGELAQYSETETPQGVLAVGRIPEWELGGLAVADRPAAVLVLDAVQDPGNYGTMVRTAEALGAAGVVSLPGTVDPWNAKSIRSAAGSLFRLPVLSCTWDELEPWLRDEEFRICAAAADGAPAGLEQTGRTALVVGNEGAGISAETLARADRIVGIPLRGRAESLNVAAAAAILLYELLR